MSRIGNEPVTIPAGIKVEISDGAIVASGPKGKVSQSLLPECPVEIKDGVIRVTRRGNAGSVRAKHGLMRALIANAVTGVSAGFTKKLQIVGVGYRAEVKGRQVEFALGFSHPVIFQIPDGIDVEIDRNNNITITGADRQKVGQVAAEMRSLRPPDPYKAKGVRYADELIRRKVGKAGAR